MAEKKNMGLVVRFFIVYLLIVIGFVLVLQRIYHIQVKESDKWLALSDSLRRIDNAQEIAPSRGNVFSSEGELMASTVPTYKIFIDLGAPSLRDSSGQLFYEHLDSLCYCLSRKFKDKSRAEYRSYLCKGFSKRSRYYPITKQLISHADYKELIQFPLFRLGSKGGLIAEKRIKRIKPYGSLAFMTLGDVYGEEGKGAKYGIEAAYDSLLRGKPGKAHYERKAGVNILVTDVEPQNGADITTTLNINMQDFAEKALRRKLQEVDAELGCAVLMEVETGKVRAIVNLKKSTDGAYRETESIVQRYRLEPGSTIKVASMIVALEDGKVTPDSIVDCGNGTWQFSKEVMISDHNTGDKANGKIPASQIIVRSSNVGIAKVINKGYGHNPQQFVNRLKEIGFGVPYDVGFKGSVKPSVLGPEDNPLWGPSDLVSMAYGYSVNIPIMYTLLFYNAIANNGVMVRPYFVEKISKDGVVLEENQPEVLKSSICSQQTLAQIKDMMLMVVEDSTHATGKPVKSEYVRIAGKTGTARYEYEGGKIPKHQVSFCGFFPYDNPKYTCIVWIRNPKIGYPSGGGMAGPVFKEIAERVMASHTYTSVEQYKSDTVRARYPKVKKGSYKATNTVFKNLQLDYKSENVMSDWISVSQANSSFLLEDIKLKAQQVPNVMGMGAKDAVFLLEKLGYKTKLRGRGTVVKQSLNPGARALKGSVITIYLQ